MGGCQADGGTGGTGGHRGGTGPATGGTVLGQSGPWFCIARIRRRWDGSSLRHAISGITTMARMNSTGTHHGNTASKTSPTTTPPKAILP